MNQEFPDAVNKQNMAQLVERAKKIKRNALWIMLGVGVFYSFLGLFLLSPLSIFVSWLFEISEPKVPSEFFPVVFLVAFFFIFFLLLILLLDLIIISLEKKGWLPKSSEQVFAVCFILANHLIKKEKSKALGEIHEFSRVLSVFTSDRYSRKKRAYSEELNILRNAKTQISRLILFSDADTVERELSYTLMNFGLSLVRNEDEKAYRNLVKLVKMVKKFGDPEGRFQKIIGIFEKHPNFWIAIIPLVIYIVSVVLVAMGILPSV